MRQLQDQIIAQLLARQQRTVEYSLDNFRAIYDAAVASSSSSEGGDVSYQAISRLRKERIVDYGRFEGVKSKAG